METFMAAYAIVGLAMASYVLRLRSQQRRLEERARALEARGLPDFWDNSTPSPTVGP